MAKKRLNTYQRWDETANTVLKGKKIVRVEYMSTKETKSYGWYKRPVTFTLDDNTRIIAMADDEGNDAGVLAYLNKDVDSVLPVLGMED